MELIPTILRGLQLLWTLLLTALIGNVIATSFYSTAAVNFAMFVIVVSWLVAIFGLATHFVDRLAIPMALLVADSTATLFTLLGGIVLAAKLGVVNCADTSGKGDGWIGYGSGDDGKRCRELQASTVFMWFLWVCFTAGLVLTFLGFRRGGGSVAGRSSVPSMSQVRV